MRIDDHRESPPNISPLNLRGNDLFNVANLPKHSKRVNEERKEKGNDKIHVTRLKQNVIVEFLFRLLSYGRRLVEIRNTFFTFYLYTSAWSSSPKLHFVSSSLEGRFDCQTPTSLSDFFPCFSFLSRTLRARRSRQLECNSWKRRSYSSQALPLIHGIGFVVAVLPEMPWMRIGEKEAWEMRDKVLEEYMNISDIS